MGACLAVLELSERWRDRCGSTVSAHVSVGVAQAAGGEVFLSSCDSWAVYVIVLLRSMLSNTA